MVMDRMVGIPVTASCAARIGVNHPRLAARGRDLLHQGSATASSRDMHPATSCAPGSRYIALDFGFMGTLTEVDKNTSRASSSPSSAATTRASRWRTWNPAGCRRTPHRRTRSAVGGVRTGVRPPAEGDFLRPRAAPAVPGSRRLTGDPAAAGAAAKDPAQYRRPRPQIDPSWIRAKRQALHRTLD